MSLSENDMPLTKHVDTVGDEDPFVHNCRKDLDELSDSGENNMKLSKLIFKTRHISEHKGIMNMNSDPSKGLYIMAQLQNNEVGVPMKLLIDCGSSMSLLDERMYEQIPDNMKPEIRQTGKQIKFADGSVQKSSGIVRIPVQVGNKVSQIDFLLGKYTDQAILGMNNIHDLALKIDFENMLVTQGDYYFPVHDIRDSLVGRKVIVRRTVVIPPRTQQIVQASVENLENKFVFSEQPAILETNCNLVTEVGIIPAKSVHQDIDESIPVMLYNPHDVEITLPDDMVVGELADVDILTDQETEASRAAIEARNKSKSAQLPDYLKATFEANSEHLSKSEKIQFKQFLIDYQDVFAKDDFDLGKCNLVFHKIETGNAKPVKIPPRRLSPEARAAADKIVQELLDRGLVEHSKSEWSAPIVMTRKKDNSYRLCCDFRGCNAVSKSDSWPQPNIHETLESLGECRIYTVCDLASGYWQIPLHPDSVEKSAFCTRRGLFQWKVLPFGLKSATATFQRLLETILGNMRFTSCLVYVDDLIVYAKDFETNIARLRDLFDKLRGANLKVKGKKCHFFQTSVEYLGHKISGSGIETCADKVQAIKDWEIPRTKKAVRSFLGVTGFYRRFIEHYSTIAKPLTLLTADKADYVWTPECQVAFDCLKERLTSSPVLGFPRAKGRYILHTDASDCGLGCTLQQEQDGQLVVIAYGSKTLGPSEMLYCTTKKELYAIVFFIHQYRHYIANDKFLVVTDHSSLRYWQRFRHAEGQLGRWLSSLSSYDFEVDTIPGKSNTAADGLSRKHEECIQLGRKKCLCPTFKELEFEPPVVLDSKTYAEIGVQTECPGHNKIIQCKSISVEPFVQFQEVEVETKSCQTSVIEVPGDIQYARVVSFLPFLTVDEIVKSQEEDPDIGPVLRSLAKSSVKPDWGEISHLSTESKILYSEWQRLVIKNGMLYRRWESEKGDLCWLQLAVPRKYWELVLQNCHDHVTTGHSGSARTLYQCRLRFFWPRMKEFINLWVASCEVCQARKPPNKTAKAPLQQYLVGAPFEKIAMDLTEGYSETDDGYKYVVCFTDCYTKFTIAVPLRSMKASEICDAFMKHWLAYFALPLEIHTDKGSGFESALFHEVCTLLNVSKTRTTTMNPRSNGGVERVQRSLVNMLNCVAKDNPFQWDQLIWLCCLAYNNTINESTKLSPSMVVFGRHLRLPTDILAPWTPKDKWLGQVTYNEQYVLKLQKALHEINVQARENLQLAKAKQGKYYNNRLVYHQYAKGDQVYYYYPVKGRNSSKESYFQWKGPLTIVAKISDCLYRVQQGPNTPSMVVHHNKLKKANCRVKPDISWVYKISPPRLVDEKNDEESGTSGADRPHRPQRVSKAPQRYGEWYYGE